VVVDIKQHKTI